MKNQVILNESPEMGKEIIKYWKARGCDVGSATGKTTEDGLYFGKYFGIIDGEFSNYTKNQVEEAKAEIIKLPPKNVGIWVNRMDLDKGKSWKAIKYLESLGGITTSIIGDSYDGYYIIDDDYIICFIERNWITNPESKEIELPETQPEPIAKPEKPELKFPRMMEVFIKGGWKEVEIHAYIPTLQLPWIDSSYSAYGKAREINPFQVSISENVFFFSNKNNDYQYPLGSEHFNSLSDIEKEQLLTKCSELLDYLQTQTNSYFGEIHRSTNNSWKSK